MIGPASMKGAYDTLFSRTRFTTDFQFDAAEILDDTALVRTHHPVGQTEHDLRDGSEKLDFNREIYVLHRTDGVWKIVLYTFNQQPRQGEQ